MSGRLSYSAQRPPWQRETAVLPQASEKVFVVRSRRRVALIEALCVRHS